MKQNILVSFSGGETSAYMIYWLLKNKPEHNYYFVFANTGEENEETLLFAKQCQDYFKIDLKWVEYDRLSFKLVDYNTAYRSHDINEIKNKWANHPFRKYISTFGIPNVVNLSCTRELKEYAIRRYMKSIGLNPKDYVIAIGIRADEIDRIGKHYYPLISPHITKPDVNRFWNNMPFRLQLKGYQGNCKTCFKKSFRKLCTIARENPEKFDFFKQMETEYENYIKKEQIEKHIQRGIEIKLPIRFFRNNMSVADLKLMAEDKSIVDAINDSNIYHVQTHFFDIIDIDSSNGCSESCEVF